jgi:hypothetical protein
MIHHNYRYYYKNGYNMILNECYPPNDFECTKCFDYCQSNKGVAVLYKGDCYMSPSRIIEYEILFDNKGMMI